MLTFYVSIAVKLLPLRRDITFFVWKWRKTPTKQPSELNGWSWVRLPWLLFAVDSSEFDTPLGSSGPASPAPSPVPDVDFTVPDTGSIKEVGFYLLRKDSERRSTLVRVIMEDQDAVSVNVTQVHGKNGYRQGANLPFWGTLFGHRGVMRPRNIVALYRSFVFVFIITCFVLLFVTCLLFLLLIFSFLSYFSFILSFENKLTP